MPSRSVYQFFLDRLSPLSGQPVFVHILPPEPDNCPSWISGRQRMTSEIIHNTSPEKIVAGPGGDRTRDLLITSRTRIWLSHRDRLGGKKWLCIICVTSSPLRGWSGGAKVSCILRHLGVQLILANSWARPAILVAGKGRGGMFLLLLFLHFHSCSFFFPVTLFHLFYYLFIFYSPFLWETTQNDPQGLTCR